MSAPEEREVQTTLEVSRKVLAEGLSLSLVPFYPAPPEIGSRRTPYTVLFLSQQLFTYHYQQLYYLQREKHETLLRILLGAVLIPLILGPPACQLIPTLGKFRHKSAAASIQQGPEPAQLTHFDHRCDSGTRTHLSVPSANAETRTSFSIIAPGVPTASPPTQPAAHGERQSNLFPVHGQRLPLRSWPCLGSPGSPKWQSGLLPLSNQSSLCKESGLCSWIL